MFDRLDLAGIKNAPDRKLNVNPIVIATTCDDRQVLTKIAKALVAENLAACCQISGPISSVFRWNDEIVESEEWICNIKTTRDRYPLIEKTILQLHSYKVPEIIVTEIVSGYKQYLEWIETESQ